MLESMRRYLDEHKVQVSKFGKGNAKSLREFYEAVVVQVRQQQWQPPPPPSHAECSRRSNWLAVLMVPKV
eukprot:6072947-Amphidinium_carterae.1